MLVSVRKNLINNKINNKIIFTLIGVSILFLGLSFFLQDYRCWFYFASTLSLGGATFLYYQYSKLVNEKYVKEEPKSKDEPKVEPSKNIWEVLSSQTLITLVVILAITFLLWQFLVVSKKGITTPATTQSQQQPQQQPQIQPQIQLQAVYPQQVYKQPYKKTQTIPIPQQGVQTIPQEVYVIPQQQLQPGIQIQPQQLQPVVHLQPQQLQPQQLQPQQLQPQQLQPQQLQPQQIQPQQLQPQQLQPQQLQPQQLQPGELKQKFRFFF